ncbi:GFA family protein [Chitiniphilus eburneus]|uniref:GFA family protein n=1 Tax=Chitiniphilus eburneus TaxID=2571148 RepID=A0A4U0Q2E5_9NEIS|nr:GFA family protein [Chitiniphilus eburneus]TJZ74202.1 GFA family protein [Chitiniphilus eburneus]
MHESKIQGSCLCGAITFEADAPFQKMIHCHCSRCRKSSGTGHATNLTVDPGQFRWLSGEAAIRQYDLPSAKRFSKWFCGHCGCPVPRLARGGAMMIIPAGALDTVPPITPTDHIFWASKTPWGCPDGGLPTHAGYPES